MKKIILLGYMGSGKSTVAKLLSEKIHFPFLDLDKIIEKEANASITEIFEKQGEIYFRKREHELFQQIIGDPNEAVLSLGGGTPCYANNHEFLNGENVISFYLKASVGELYQRLLSEKTHRPLLANLNPDEMKEFIAINLFERSFYYLKATHAIAVDAKSPEQIVAEIEQFLV